MSHLDEGVFHALLDGEIPSAELPPIQAHLAGCAECRASLDEARAFREAAESLVEEIQPSEGVIGTSPRVRPAPRPAWGRRLAWAASLLVAAGLGYTVRPQGRGGEAGVVLTQPAPSVPNEQTATAQAAEPSPPTSALAAPAPVPALTPRTRETDSRRAVASRTPQRAAKTLAEAEKKATPSQADSLVVAGGAAGRVAANAAPLAPAPALAASAAKASATTPASPPASRQETPGELTAGLSRSLKQPMRLDEVVVSSADAARDLAKVGTPISVIQFPDAVRRLGGTLRLVEGLVPLRIEAQGSMVRVIYPADRGELILGQWVSDGRLLWMLSGPPGFPADSLNRLRARVRE